MRSTVLSNVSPVALFLTTTVAPGITPPPESTTVPESDWLPPWAYARELDTSTNTTAVSSRPALLLIIHPPFADGLAKTFKNEQQGANLPGSRGTVKSNQWNR